MIDYAQLLSTPRELCKDCYNWCTQEDVGEYDFPQCIEGFDDECRDYLCHFKETCSKHLVQ